MLRISPVGLAATALTANQVSLLAVITEKLARPICTNSTIQPQVSVSYTTGTPVFNGTTVFIPVQATVSIITQGCNNRANTQLFTETFDIAFQGQTVVPTSVTLTSVGRNIEGTNVRCGRAYTYTIYDSITVTIA